MLGLLTRRILSHRQNSNMLTHTFLIVCYGQDPEMKKKVKSSHGMEGMGAR